jgi:hypothetical protein
MTTLLKHMAVLVTVLSAAQAYAADQPATSAAPATSVITAATAVSAAPALQSLPPRDPTVPSADLRSALDRGSRSTGAGHAGAKAPEITLRGRIQMAGKPVVALIEVGGKNLYPVTEGTRLTVESGRGEGLTLQIVRLTLDEVEIEVVGLHQKVTVR